MINDCFVMMFKELDVRFISIEIYFQIFLFRCFFFSCLAVIGVRVFVSFVVLFVNLKCFGKECKWGNQIHMHWSTNGHSGILQSRCYFMKRTRISFL